MTLKMNISPRSKYMTGPVCSLQVEPQKEDLTHLREYEAGGISFVGCIVLGVGVGLLFGHVASGAVIGVGAGFLVMAFFRGR